MADNAFPAHGDSAPPHSRPSAGPAGELVAAIEATGVVAIIRTKDPARVFDIVDALARGGVRTLEITMTVPGAIEVIRSVAASLPEGILLGAGTVLDAATAHQVIDAGARFVVAPVFDPETVRACNERDVPVMPGCYTPTEMLQAWRAGADLIKVFPATSLGPGYLKDIAAPLPQLKLDADRRGDARERRHVDQGRRRRRRHRLGPGRHQGRRGGRLRADRSRRPARHRQHRGRPRGTVTPRAVSCGPPAPLTPGDPDHAQDRHLR